MLSTLMDVKVQLVALQEKVDSLIRCVEEKNDMGLGHVACGPDRQFNLLVAAESSRWAAEYDWARSNLEWPLLWALAQGEKQRKE